ncbi:MAG: hypothetical protein HY063_13245 [Bacteroidetes bacterium]|nr:hypothetical protein [Bacteroidota bacterium]
MKNEKDDCRLECVNEKEIKILQLNADGHKPERIRKIMRLSEENYNDACFYMITKLNCHTLARAVGIVVNAGKIKVKGWKKFRSVQLTPCEKKILQHYADGYDCGDIKKIEGKSKNTIHNQRESIKRKLKSKTIARAVALGLVLLLVEFTEP